MRTRVCKLLHTHAYTHLHDLVVVANITIAAKLQRPVLLARERPRAPQNHNTTPYKIQYDAAAGRHLPVTATTSSSRHPRS